jgi:hypothetical protein
VVDLVAVEVAAAFEFSTNAFLPAPQQAVETFGEESDEREGTRLGKPCFA